jgi:hypothetical protein
MAKSNWKIKEYTDKLKVDINNKMAEIGDVVKDNAKAICPVKTGKLRDSIHKIVIPDPEIPSVKIGSQVEYAWFIEMGTRKIAPRAFLRRGLADSIANILGILSRKDSV